MKKIITALTISIIIILLGIYFIAKPQKNERLINPIPKRVSIVKKSNALTLKRTEFSPIDKLQYKFSYDIFIKDSSNCNHNQFRFFDHNYSQDTFSIFCFRGNQMRSSPSRGFVLKKPTDIIEDWEFKTGYDTTKTKFGIWGGGSGWTGQPLAICWTEDQKQRLNIKDSVFVNNPKAMELIIGSLCGNIYFLNIETGIPTRKELSIGNPIKGTLSVDPRKNGLLYIGQGIPKAGRMGAYIFDMFESKEIEHIPGIDNFSYRSWGAFDSNPLIDNNSGTVFWPSENGLVYKFQADANKVLHQPIKFRYKHEKMFRQGIESSMAVKGKYGILSDNSGTILCLDLEKMRPIWNIDNFDDTDASVLMEDDSKNSISIYIGNEVDKRAPKSKAQFRKINAVTGNELWNVSRECFGTQIEGKTNSGGILSSPASGKYKGSDIVYTIFSRVDGNNRGEFVAIKKDTGKELFSIFLESYSWSSPVDFYDKEGNIYIFFSDLNGIFYIVDGVTGEILVKKKTGQLIEASPIIINDRIILASRGKLINSFKIK
jgi:outer membrane protein assembly factor BamB